MAAGDVIAIGGGGFSEGFAWGLDDYVLAQAPAARPKVGFIGTASGDAEAYLLKFYQRFAQLGCEPSHLPLFRRTPDIARWIEAQDIVYVGGGNTRSLLALWHGWGLPPLLESAARRGTVLAGISAGAICWFEAGVTDSNAGRLQPLPCLGFVSGSCCPHYVREAERRPCYEAFVRQGEIADGIAIDDGAAVHFRDGKPLRVVSGGDDALAYRVARTAAGVSARPLDDEVARVTVEDGDEETGNAS